MAKYVYSFGAKGTDGDASMKNMLGGKGANLAEMARLGMPVPAGFTITTEFCTAYFEAGGKFPEELKGHRVLVGYTGVKAVKQGTMKLFEVTDCGPEERDQPEEEDEDDPPF